MKSTLTTSAMFLNIALGFNSILDIDAKNMQPIDIALIGCAMFSFTIAALLYHLAVSMESK